MHGPILNTFGRWAYLVQISTHFFIYPITQNVKKKYIIMILFNGSNDFDQISLV